MAEPASPLQVIKQKELVLQHRIEEARREAEVQVQAAREQAEQIIAQADREGRAEADALFDRGIEEARLEAKAMLDSAHEEAAALRRQATARLDEATRQVVEFVLPSGT